ncbi:MAG: phosphatase PAP2 family protein [Bdellovibrio sp.]|nr:phosphatase PAP2 family protein [Bdellovibrio sp.]
MLIKVCILIVAIMNATMSVSRASAKDAPSSKDPTYVNIVDPPTPWERFKKNLFSPLTTPAKYAFWPGMTLSILLAKAEDSYSDPVQTEMWEKNPLRDSTYVGNLWGSMIPNVAYYLAMKSIYWFGSDYNSHVRANHMAEGTLYTIGVINALKFTIREPRPNRLDNLSFPSGHAGMSFVFATIVAEEHGRAWGIPAYLMAVFVSATRLNDNWHYTHDVIAGATLGIAYGYGIYYNRKHVFKENDYVVVAPIVCNNTLGIGISKSF